MVKKSRLKIKAKENERHWIIMIFMVKKKNTRQAWAPCANGAPRPPRHRHHHI